MSESPDWVFHRDGLTEADLMPRLLTEFPGFQPRWQAHLEYWKGEPAGNYNDMAQFVHFVVEDLYATGQTQHVQRVFEIMEQWLTSGSETVRGLIVVGFLETLQTSASWQVFGNEAFIPFLGPKSREAWKEIERWWAGKSSLAEVIEAERNTPRD
jgi:hypothetical protein